MDCNFAQVEKNISFSKNQIDWIRDMMFVGSVSTPSIDNYLDNATEKQRIEANKILYKLGFEGIGKDGRELDWSVKEKKWK